jgi:hypothetical protein
VLAHTKKASGAEVTHDPFIQSSSLLRSDAENFILNNRSQAGGVFSYAKQDTYTMHVGDTLALILHRAGGKYGF